MSHVFTPARAALCAVGAALALLAAAGCSNDQPQTPPTIVTPAPAPTTTVTTNAPSATTTTPPGGVAPATKVNVNAGPGGSMGVNSATADAVNKAIVTNKEMTGSRIEVVVDASGVATLTGTTQDQQQKALAARTASNTPGVSSVKNKIEIVPTGGAKSASKPPVTKVIVIHQQAPAPPSPANSPNPPAQPAQPDTSTGGTSDNGTSATPPATPAAPTGTGQ